MDINLHIECLVLEGIDIPCSEQEVLLQSVASELTRMLGDDALGKDYSKVVSLAQISTAGISVDNRKPRDFGRSIAKSVYGGIAHE